MTSAVFLDFKGMNVEHVTKLRAEFRKSGVEYKVVKNTLVKQALKDNAVGDKLDTTLSSGMTGVAWSYEDPSAAAKVVKAFRKDEREAQGQGRPHRRPVSTAKPSRTSSRRCPARTSSARMLLATLQAPLQQFVVLLNAPAQNFVYLLAAKEREGDERLSDFAAPPI